MKQTITIEWDYGCSLDELIDDYILDEMRCEIEDLDLSKRTIECLSQVLDKVKNHLKSYIRDPKEKRGEWTYYGQNKDGIEVFQCSECRKNAYKSKYCPYCGSRME